MGKDNENDYAGLDRRQANPLILEKLDRINGSVNDIKGIAEDNRRALRGHNKTPGLVGDVKTNADNIEKLEKKSNRNDTIVGIMTGIGTVIGFIFGEK